MRWRGAGKGHPAPLTLCSGTVPATRHGDLRSHAQGCLQECHSPHCLNYSFLANKREQMPQDLPGFSQYCDHRSPGCPHLLGPALWSLCLSPSPGPLPWPTHPARPLETWPLAALLPEPALPGGETAHVWHLPQLRRTLPSQQNRRQVEARAWARSRRPPRRPLIELDPPSWPARSPCEAQMTASLQGRIGIPGRLRDRPKAKRECEVWMQPEEHVPPGLPVRWLPPHVVRPRCGRESLC